MILNYKLFLENIQLIRNLSYEEAYEDFLKSFGYCLEKLSEENHDQFSISYSYTAKKKLQRNKQEMPDPEEDFNLIEKNMNKLGWTFEKAKLVYNKMQELNPESYQNLYKITSCAPGDYYLYKLTDKKFELQGYAWDKNNESTDDRDDIFVKFSYGWQFTKYGKIAILQNFESIEEFYRYSFKHLKSYITELIINEYSNEISQLIYNKIESHIMYSDKFELYIDSNAILNDIKNYLDIEKEDYPIQSDIDNFIKNTLKNIDIDCIIPAEGDIKVSI